MACVDAHCGMALSHGEDRRKEEDMMAHAHGTQDSRRINLRFAGMTAAVGDQTGRQNEKIPSANLL